MNRNKSLLFILCCVCVFIFVSCGQQQEAEESQSGRYVSDPATDEDGIIRILVYYDMEGTSGMNDIRQILYGNKEYDAARDWLTDDVNATIDGLFAGGADEVHVVDAHGSGNPEPDVLLDRLDSRAEMIFREERFRPYADLAEKSVYDAVAVVCMHSRRGGGGFAAHSVTIGMEWILNDMSITESEIIAYYFGTINVPVIFATGDDKLEEQLEWMDWLEYVRVKKAKGPEDAELMPFETVHAEMRSDAKRAVENIATSKAVHLTLPIKAQLRASHPASLSQLKGVPGIDYADQTVTFEANDYKEAYDGMSALMGVATQGYSDLMMRAVQTQDNGSEIFNEFRDALIKAWMDVEAGRWKPPAAPKSSDPKKKYFGAQ